MLLLFILFDDVVKLHQTMTTRNMFQQSDFSDLVI